MAHPWGTHYAGKVVDAAVAKQRAEDAVRDLVDMPSAERFRRYADGGVMYLASLQLDRRVAVKDLEEATRLYIAAVAVPHQQGPDMDADEKEREL